MKRLTPALVVVATIFVIANFDHIIVFMLSGFVPGIGVTIPPSTMVAIPIACALLLLSLRHFEAVYQRCLSHYDRLASRFAKIIDKNSQPKIGKNSLPRRRYQQL